MAPPPLLPQESQWEEQQQPSPPPPSSPPPPPPSELRPVHGAAAGAGVDIVVIRGTTVSAEHVNSDGN